MKPSLKYFPRALLEHMDDRGGIVLPKILKGTCLFADVSGFTAMSEALLAMGREGSEVLTKVLNIFYSDMVRVILAGGGDVMRFAGDAVTVHFPDEPTAVRVALQMQALMPRFQSMPTPAGEFTLKMKVGMASGEAELFTVEGADRLDYVYWGGPVDGSAEAEHHARAGEIVLHRDDTFIRIETLPDQERISPGQPANLRKSGEPPQTYLHPMLWEALASGQEAFLNEHRNTSILFIAFAPQSREKSDIGSIRNFYRRAVDTVKVYDGYINKVDMGDKGSKLLILFGAPRAHEDDEARALACAGGLVDSAKETGFSLRMGLNAARVFCGVVGSPERCEYTVMGDGVNVAARLMQAAPEQACLVSPSVKSRSAALYQFRDLPPLTLKGKKELFPVALLEGPRREEEELPFFIGRTAETDMLRGYLKAQPQNQAGLFVVHGEAGVPPVVSQGPWSGRAGPFPEVSLAYFLHPLPSIPIADPFAGSNPERGRDRFSISKGRRLDPSP
jgi:class 3 adenylate cyclase